MDGPRQKGRPVVIDYRSRGSDSLHRRGICAIIEIRERVIVMTEMTVAKAWDYAIGLIKVDGLEPTEDFKKYIELKKQGKATTLDLNMDFC